MTLIHTSELKSDNLHRHRELHRVGALTFEVEIEFYPNSIEYSNALLSILNGNNDWTQLADHSVELWYGAAKAKEGYAERIPVFKAISEFLLQVGCEATGLLPPSPAEDLHKTEEE